MNEISLRAYAKVNIGLDITGRRPDGFHLVEMVMQTVDIYDTVSVEKLSGSADGDPRIYISADKPGVPQGEDNLAWKAAELVMRSFGINQPVGISLEKNIPMAGGMAGGSTDAAAVLLALNELFELSLSPEELDGLAVRLGADVPFCLRRGTYLARGVGEKLKKLKDFPNCGVLIINPGFGVSTAWAYRAVDGARNALAHPDIRGLCKAIEEGNLKEACGAAGNIFEAVVFRRHPEIAAVKEKLKESGALAALMSGSGATVFGIFESEAAAGEALRNFEGDAAPVFLKAGRFKF